MVSLYFLVIDLTKEFIGPITTDPMVVCIACHLQTLWSYCRKWQQQEQPSCYSLPPAGYRLQPAYNPHLCVGEMDHGQGGVGAKGSGGGSGDVEGVGWIQWQWHKADLILPFKACSPIFPPLIYTTETASVRSRRSIGSPSVCLEVRNIFFLPSSWPPHQWMQHTLFWHSYIGAGGRGFIES